MALELEETTEIPPVAPPTDKPRQKRKYTKRRTREEIDAAEGIPPREKREPEPPKEPAGVPIPKSITDAVRDVPFIVAAKVWQVRTGRTLEIPVGPGAELALGPEQIAAMYLESKAAFDKMTETLNLRIPAWLAYLGTVIGTLGGAVMLDMGKMMAEAQAQFYAQQAAQQSAEQAEQLRKQRAMGT